ATAGYDTDLNAKVNASLESLNRYDFVFLHIKATDIAGHDGDFRMKVKLIEKIDKVLKPITKLKDTVVVITGDHSTPCSMKAHSADPVPLLIWGPKEMIRSDYVKRFDERSVANGGLGNIKHMDIMPIVLGIIKKAKMYGT
ncbi:MAG: phosphoglycerate mutase, partial [Candidatus Micrarchaeota archaeon]|nr:phosphoglycerate mutase [Candidatus Micrarchaeota archaeon]